MAFFEQAKETLLNGDNNISVTENGATGYASTGKELTDLNFAVSSMRNMDENEIKKRFSKAYFENPRLAIKWLFFATDARGGMGERRLFKICFNTLLEFNPEYKHLIPLVPHYGRWDSLFSIESADAQKYLFVFLKTQIQDDIRNMKSGDNISLLAKWLPTMNPHNKDDKGSHQLALKLYRRLGFKSPKEYRKTISTLRKYIDVVERKMCDNEWDEINYQTVPSKANLNYAKAFMKHDKERRTEYLNKLVKGEVKINSSTLYPHEILHKYDLAAGEDTVLEELWKSLPDYLNGKNSNTICVCDTSGSMNAHVSDKSDVTAREVAFALTIYFSERSSGEFKDKFITFSSRPQLIDISSCESLRDKYYQIKAYQIVEDTNIEAVFDLVLKTAVENNLSQEEIPNILVLSDMEFNDCAVDNRGDYVDDRLFKVIDQKYNSYGYKLPKLSFWNICSRTMTIPVKDNEFGLSLVSGFSPSVMDIVLSEEIDPYKAIVDKLNTERYNAVDSVLDSINL